MGYNTQFSGTLLFKKEPSLRQLKRIEALLSEDVREHPDLAAIVNNSGVPLLRCQLSKVSYIDLAVDDNYTGLVWTGAEKTYGLEHAVNVVLAHVRHEYPDFGLTGELLAQGEDIEDRWRLIIAADGWADKVPVVLPGRCVTCPHCHRTFTTETKEVKHDATASATSI